MLELPRHPLHRYYGDGDYHFITTSCDRRKPLLGSARARDIFLEVLEQVRRKCQFDVIGFERVRHRSAAALASFSSGKAA